jgi:hypothetical protein
MTLEIKTSNLEPIRQTMPISNVVLVANLRLVIKKSVLMYKHQPTFTIVHCGSQTKP